MRKNIIWISLFSFAMTTIAESSIASVNTGIFPLLAKNRKKAEPKDSVASDYKKLTGRDSVALKGIANIIKKNGSFYLEFPTRLLGREFLVTNRLQKVPLELNEAGVNKGINYENQVVTFEWQREGKKLSLNPQLHSRSATYIKRNGLLIRKITIKSSRPFQCAYHPLTP